MDKKVPRPLLFAGEIVSIIAFAASIVFYIVWAYLMLVAGALAEGLTGAAADTSEIFAIFYYMLALVVISIVGVIITSVACANSRSSAEKFKQKQGIIIASGVYSIVFCVISAVGVYFTNFISLVLWCALLAGAVLVFVGRKKVLNIKIENELEPVNTKNQSPTESSN